MRVVTIDYETFYDSKTYTLSKMGPIEYIRDPRFKVLCVGVRINKGKTVVCEAKNGLDARFLQALKLDESGTLVVGHNMAGFDALILSEYYGIHPWMIVDTIPMMHWLGLSRIIPCTHKALTAELKHGIKQAGTVVSDGKRNIEDFTAEEWVFFKQYCADDVTQCSENFYSMLPFVKNPDALRLMSITAKMATEPAFIPDLKMLKEYLVHLEENQEKARLNLAHVLHFDTSADLLKAIRSPKKFPVLLEQIGGVCPMKWSEKKQCEVPACSKQDLEFVAMAEDENPDVALLVQTKLDLNSSIQQSRTQSLIRKGSKPVPIMLSAYKAHTGRYAAGGEGATDGLNFQNISKRDPTKMVIRQALKVPEGMAVVACDSSQVEARMLAWVAEQNDLVEQFRTGRDPYAEMASKIYHVDANAIHAGAKNNDDPNHALYKKYRNLGKTCILSAGYAIGANLFSEYLLRSKIKLSEDLEEHRNLASEALVTYRTSNPMIKRFWKVCDNLINELSINQSMGEHLRFGRGDMLVTGWDYIPATTFKAPYILLPNGYRLWYPDLQEDVDDTGKRTLYYSRIEHGKKKLVRVYGPLVTENCIQSLAFHMLAWQACRMDSNNIHIVANIHDSFATVVPQDMADYTKHVMECVMSSVPDWLEGFPVGCEAEVGSDFTIV